MGEPQPPLDRSRDLSQPLDRLNQAERLKADSDYLRGDVREALVDGLTGSLPGEAPQLIKFFGIYQQDDRDLRDERRRQKLEPAYEFMVRLRLPGGVCQPAQWLQLDELVRRYGQGSLRLTTRQTFQFHGILKKDLKRALLGINAALLDTLGACGDVNRGIVCSPWPGPLQSAMFALAKELSDRLTPRTRAYHEIWLGEQRIDGGGEVEPIYGRTYLPRKFKIGFVAPPVNDVDIYAQDLGFIAIVQDGQLAGFNVTAGGGLGRTDNEPATFPRLADIVGFCPPHRVVALAEAVVGIQRDFGDRVDRKHARFKYTVDDRGIEWLRRELSGRLGWEVEAPLPYRFDTNGDRHGWHHDQAGWHYGLFVENGRLRGELLDGLREIARLHSGDIRLTPNQNVIIAGVDEANRAPIDDMLGKFRLERFPSALRRNAIACVALPTCGLAMAEAERYLPLLVTKLEKLLAACGLADEPMTIRMSGCPNGCARPYIAEIGFSGRAPGKYNVYLGGGFHGQRLNSLFLENVGEERILAELEAVFRRFADERRAGEHFGDFVLRAGFVPEVREGRDFNRPRG